MSNKTSFLCALSASVLMAVAGAAIAGAPGAGAPAAGPPGGGGPGGAGAFGAPPQGGRGGGRGAGAAPAGLGAAMRDMAAMLNGLKADVGDDSKIEANIQKIIQFERDVAIAKMATPPVAKLDADKQAKAPANFRAAMTTLQRTLLDLEDAVAAKKADDVKKLIAKLEEVQKAGHAEFKVGQ